MLLQRRASTHLREHQTGDRDEADHERERISVRGVAQEVGQVAVADRDKTARQASDRGTHDHDGEAAEDQHPGQGDDERGDSHVRDPVALPHADDRSDRHADEHRDGPGQAPRLHRDRHDATHEGDNRTDRQVDVTGHDHHDHADRQDHDIRVLLDQCRDVVRHQQPAAGHPLEEKDDHDECAHDPVLAHVAAEILPDGGHRDVTSFSLVIRAMSDSWVASARESWPVTRPWLSV
ncbi:hypothetical protein GALL_495200 [mine drainage metagenome]|uniref:Uncharacterized protein n=1 Tax=mine drainage metagenome TaxID=410659 RepID=A0A1J5PCD1_9ZZZZ